MKRPPDYYIEVILSRIKLGYYKLMGCNFGSRIRLSRGVQFHLDYKKIRLSNLVALDRHVTIICAGRDNSSRFLVDIGIKVYINRFTVIDAVESITIGAETMIGSHCYITDHDHSFQGFSPTIPKGQLPLTGSPTTIEENVWIGSHVVVLKGVSIGRNSVIGAGSVVTRSIPPNVVAVGNPCRVLKELDIDR